LTLINNKKSLALLKLTSCGSCFDVTKDNADDFIKLHHFYNIYDLRNRNKIDKKYDIIILEGHPRTRGEIALAKLARHNAKIVIAIGSCAQMGGVYLQKNESTLNKVIYIDYVIPGCPIDHQEIILCLVDLYWGKRFLLPDLSVCFECQKNGNDCLLEKEQPCLGPITRMGCNSICLNHGEVCLGCRGLKPDANIDKMQDILKQNSSEKDASNLTTIFGKLIK